MSDTMRDLPFNWRKAVNVSNYAFIPTVELEESGCAVDHEMTLFFPFREVTSNDDNTIDVKHHYDLISIRNWIKEMAIQCKLFARYVVDSTTSVLSGFSFKFNDDVEMMHFLMKWSGDAPLQF